MSSSIQINDWKVQSVLQMTYSNNLMNIKLIFQSD